MDRPRVQFTIFSLLLATFWAASSVAVWTIPKAVTFGPEWIFILALRWICPVVVVGVLFDWRLLILVWSIAVVAALLFLLACLLILNIAAGLS